MADNGGAALITNEDKVVQQVSASDEEIRLLSDVIHSLPPVAVQDLLTTGVCVQCIIRLFGIYGPSYSRTSQLLSILPVPDNNVTIPTVQPASCGMMLGRESCPYLSGASSNQGDICRVCCGILQFIYVDDRGRMMRCSCAYDLAVLIAEFVKKEGHQPDGVLLEVSIPPALQEHDDAISSTMKQKYGSEAWYHEKMQSNIITAKDALKVVITNPLEELLGVKGVSSSFHIRLTYTSPHATMNSDPHIQSNLSFKRRKSGGHMDRRDPQNWEKHPVQRRFNSSTDSSSKCLPREASACCLTFDCGRMSVYIGGRYLKYSRNVSQTCWIIDDERKGEASVEEILGGGILPLFHGDSYKFHGAGREDIDVRMLGSGRPFLIEVQNPRVIPSEVLVKELEKDINISGNKLVGVKNLSIVDSHVWTMMREGEAEKQKQYVALVWISRELEEEDLQTISSLKDMAIVQRTPIRVLHRRSPLEREKMIHWMNIEKVAGSSQYFLLHLCTQAGTYIKEFVHGDLGRTNPSIGSILGCRAEILQLDVTDVKMDCFLPI